MTLAGSARRGSRADRPASHDRPDLRDPSAAEHSFRYASRADRDKPAKALKPVCAAPTEGAALERFDGA
ncbi:hypothetical protein SUDANB176_00194 [Streptomyces sp. enrichment culture]